MTEIRRADPAARRHAVFFVVLGTLVGALLIVGFERYRISFRDWLLSGPGASAHRVKLVFLLSATALSAPPVAFAVHLWLLGAKVLRTQQFPPPGYRVIRHTPILTGRAAMSRGRGLKVLALCLGLASVLVWLLLWRLAWTLGDGVAWHPAGADCGGHRCAPWPRAARPRRFRADRRGVAPAVPRALGGRFEGEVRR